MHRHVIDYRLLFEKGGYFIRILPNMRRRRKKCEDALYKWNNWVYSMGSEAVQAK